MHQISTRNFYQFRPGDDTNNKDAIYFRCDEEHGNDTLRRLIDFVLVNPDPIIRETFRRELGLEIYSLVASIQCVNREFTRYRLSVTDINRYFLHKELEHRRLEQLENKRPVWGQTETSSATQKYNSTVLQYMIRNALQIWQLEEHIPTRMAEVVVGHLSQIPKDWRPLILRCLCRQAQLPESSSFRKRLVRVALENQIVPTPNIFPRPSTHFGQSAFYGLRPEVYFVGLVRFGNSWVPGQEIKIPVFRLTHTNIFDLLASKNYSAPLHWNMSTPADQLMSEVHQILGDRDGDPMISLSRHPAMDMAHLGEARKKWHRSSLTSFFLQFFANGIGSRDPKPLINRFAELFSTWGELGVEKQKCVEKQKYEDRDGIIAAFQIAKSVFFEVKDRAPTVKNANQILANALIDVAIALAIPQVIRLFETEYWEDDASLFSIAALSRHACHLAMHAAKNSDGFLMNWIERILMLIVKRDTKKKVKVPITNILRAAIRNDLPDLAIHVLETASLSDQIEAKVLSTVLKYAIVEDHVPLIDMMYDYIVQTDQGLWAIGLAWQNQSWRVIERLQCDPDIVSNDIYYNVTKSRPPVQNKRKFSGSEPDAKRAKTLESDEN